MSQLKKWCLVMATLGWATIAQPQNQAPQAITWEQIRDRFQANNPTLKAAQLSIDPKRGLKRSHNVLTAKSRLNRYVLIR